tara:strand:+ start:239 stop:529 length:291 start_codon:yes stop_codon:yes gene_type:complete
MYNCHPEHSPELLFNIGTPAYMPKYDKILHKFNKNEQLFWMYMKDWYGFGKTVMEKGDYIGIYLTTQIQNMEKENVKRILNNLIKHDRPFYLEPNF